MLYKQGKLSPLYIPGNVNIFGSVRVLALVAQIVQQNNPYNFTFLILIALGLCRRISFAVAAGQPSPCPWGG